MVDMEYLKSKPGAMRVIIIIASALSAIVGFMSKGESGLGNVAFFMIIAPIVAILSGFILFRHATDQLTQPIFNVPYKKFEFLVYGGSAFLLFIGCCVVWANGETSGQKIAGVVSLVAVIMMGVLAHENHKNPEEVLVRGESQQPVVKEKNSSVIEESGSEIDKNNTMNTGISNGNKSESSEVFNQLHGQHNPSVDNKRSHRYGSNKTNNALANAPATNCEKIIIKSSFFNCCQQFFHCFFHSGSI